MIVSIRNSLFVLHRSCRQLDNPAKVIAPRKHDDRSGQDCDPNSGCDAGAAAASSPFVENNS
jgi:hypothetical protein